MGGFRRGYTLIEMSVVIVILLLMALMVIPNMVAIRRTRELLDLEAAIRRLPIEAQNEARRARTPMALRVDGDALVIERLPQENASDQEGQIVKRLAIEPSIQAESAYLAGERGDLASWKWIAYPDGSTDRGGLEFLAGAARKSLFLDGKGAALWLEGDLPDTSQERWSAGDIERLE